MSSTSSQNEFSHRQGSITSLPEEDDPLTTSSDPSAAQQRLKLSNGYSKLTNLDDSQSYNVEKEYQTASIDLQTVPDTSNEDHVNQNWEQLYKRNTIGWSTDKMTSQSDSTDDLTQVLDFNNNNSNNSQVQQKIYRKK